MAELGNEMINHYAPGVSSADLVTHLYQVLIETAPAAEIVQNFVNQIGENQLYENQGEFFSYAASLPINANPVTDLVGNIQQLDPIWF